jgi:two-component system, NarL family, nitrate/nitrite response regulator NarL
MIRVFIAVDIRLYREGLAETLGRKDGLSIVGAHRCSPEALSHIVELHPDVVLLDAGTPQNHALAREIQRSAPRTSIVALGVGESAAQMLAYAEAGITGYLTHDTSLEDLIVVVESAARGEAICSPQLAGTLVRRLAALAADREPDPPDARLTSREREIVALIERDLSNKEIANSLGIEVATVKNHVHNVLEKLSVHRRSEVIRLLSRARRAAMVVTDSVLRDRATQAL